MNNFIKYGVLASVIRVLDDDDFIVQVSLGGAHSSALSSTGRLFTWGRAANGQLGDGQDSTNQTTPVEITTQGDLDLLQ